MFTLTKQQRSHQASLKSLKSNQCGSCWLCWKLHLSSPGWSTICLLHPQPSHCTSNGDHNEGWRSQARLLEEILSDDLSMMVAPLLSASKLCLFTYRLCIQTSTVIVWSDGCSSQYKSKLPFYNISTAFNSNFQVVWNYFSSRHGKSSADGETAVAKTFLGSEASDTNLVLKNARNLFSHLVRSGRHIVNG